MTPPALGVLRAALELIEACQLVARLVADIDEKDWQKDEPRRLATRYALIVLGNSAASYCQQAGIPSSTLPWAGPIGMRQVLAHAPPSEIVDAEVWLAIRQGLPALLTEAEHLFDSPPRR